MRIFSYCEDSEPNPLSLGGSHLRGQKTLALDHLLNQSIGETYRFLKSVGTEEDLSFVVRKGEARLFLVGRFLSLVGKCFLLFRRYLRLLPSRSLFLLVGRCLLLSGRFSLTLLGLVGELLDLVGMFLSDRDQIFRCTPWSRLERSRAEPRQGQTWRRSC